MPAAASSEPAHDGQCDWSRVIAGPLAPPPVILARGPMKPLHSLCAVTTPQARGEGGARPLGLYGGSKSPTCSRSVSCPPRPPWPRQSILPAPSLGHRVPSLPLPDLDIRPVALAVRKSFPGQHRGRPGRPSAKPLCILGISPPAQPPPSARRGGSGAQFSTDVFFTRCSRASLLGNSP